MNKLKALFAMTPEKMKAKLIQQAELRVVECEHAENHWRHEAAKAREELQRLTGRKVIETTFNPGTYVRNIHELARDTQTFMMSQTEQPGK